MSTGSSRTVRWFGTRVPLISRGVLSIVVLIVALPLSGMIYILWSSLLFTVYWFVPLSLIIPVGTISYFMFLMILQTRYKNPQSNPEFTEMSGRVHQKILVPSRAQVWVRESVNPYIVSTYNPVFDAVIVSQPMVDLMLERPQAGEVLLAYHLARIPRNRWFGDFGGSLILLALFTYLSAIFLIPLIISVMSMMSVMGAFILISLGSAFMYAIVIPLLPTLIIKGAFWRHEPAFMRIQEIYGMHPQVAKVEVERGTPLNEEEIQAVVWGVKEWEKKKRSGRRWGVSTLFALPSWFVLIFVASWFIGGFPFYFYYFLAYVPFIGAFLIGALVYFILRRWDKNAMGEVFHETIDSHEPIWMD
jgi:hypothetical protein